MRDAIGGAWILGIIMVFMVFMIAFVYVSIDYNHVYKTKTELVNVVEQYQGINPTSRKKIAKILSGNSYIGQNTCNLTSKSTSTSKESNYYICYYKNSWGHYLTTDGGHKCEVCITSSYYPKSNSSSYDQYYYNIEVFLKFDLPVIGRIMNFRVPGSTNAVYYPYNDWPWNYSS